MNFTLATMKTKKISNALQIYTLLNGSNCRECGAPTCMAFSGAVYTGQKKLSDCPYISKEILLQYGEKPGGETAISENIDRAVQHLKEEISKVDLQRIAINCGGTFDKDRLTIKVLGKNFSVDQKGNIYTDIHIIPWVVLPVYNYILRQGSHKLSGNWVPLRELPSGKDWYRLFGQRCEKPLKKIADSHPDLFADLIRLFSAKEVEQHYSSDISVLLHPLPKLPMLICYWYPENELESDLNLFFDDSAEDFLDINSINSIGSGFVTMLEKLILRHGKNG